MKLADLYPPGTGLAQVPLYFRGMSLRAWKCEQVSLNAEAFREAITPKQISQAPLSRKAISTPRDRYGLKW